MIPASSHIKKPIGQAALSGLPAPPQSTPVPKETLHKG